MFPLEARAGGTLVRAGHTEAAVDLARIAGLNPSGVICEIMNEDGTMSRLPDLIAFAQHHGLKIGTIADLIAYRLKNDRVVERVAEMPFEITVAGDDPVMVRMHALNVLDDVLGDAASGKSGDLQQAMQMISDVGRGVVVLIREPYARALSDRVKTRIGETPEGQGELRDYGVGAQILLDLGVSEMILLSNTKRTIVGLDGYDLSVTEQRAIPKVKD